MNPVITDLELWLIGPPAALDAAARALAGIGRVCHHSDREALTGEDTGRSRLYARIYVPITTQTPDQATDQGSDQDLTDGW